MELINLEKYQVFCKYHGDLDLMLDHRTGDARDQKKITEQEWSTIGMLLDDLGCLKTKKYSFKLETEMKNRIEKAKLKFDPEVYQMIINGEKPIKLTGIQKLKNVLFTSK